VWENSSVPGPPIHGSLALIEDQILLEFIVPFLEVMAEITPVVNDLDLDLSCFVISARFENRSETLRDWNRLSELYRHTGNVVVELEYYKYYSIVVYM
jgi:N12 class adenine-specific DNA methylase